VTRGQLPQRAGSLGQNGGGTAAAVPLGRHRGWPVDSYWSMSPSWIFTHYSNQFQPYL